MPADTSRQRSLALADDPGYQGNPGTADRLRKAGAQFITPDVVAIPQEDQAKLGFKKALMIRDPNGHALRLIEE